MAFQRVEMKGIWKVWRTTEDDLVCLLEAQTDKMWGLALVEMSSELLLVH
jgi:hypothetical protein